MGADEPESSFIRASSLESSSLSCTVSGRIQKMIHVFCLVDSFPDHVLEPGNETFLRLVTLSQAKIVYNGNCLRQPLIAKMAAIRGAKKGKKLLSSSLQFTSLLEWPLVVEGNGSHWV